MVTARSHKTAIVVALITAMGGLITAVVNRVSPAEPTAERGYEVTRDVIKIISDDLDSLEARVLKMEEHGREAHKKPKRDRKRRVRFLPRLNMLQQALPPEEDEE